MSYLGGVVFHLDRGPQQFSVLNGEDGENAGSCQQLLHLQAHRQLENYFNKN